MNRFSRNADFSYAWVVAAVSFITLLAAAGFRSTPGVLFIPLEDEFGWSRATVGAAVSVNLLLFGFVGPFAAALMIRYGLRKVIAGALLTISAGALLTTQIREPWQLVLLWGVVVGLGAGCMATVLAATVANRWFVARRSLVVGVLTAAGATGPTGLPAVAGLAGDQLQLAPRLHHDRAGGPGGAAAGAHLHPGLAGRRGADGVRGDEGRSPPARPKGNPIANAFEGLQFAITQRDFWLLAIPFLICGLSTNGLIGTHLIPAGVDHGMTEMTAAGLLAMVGIFDIVGTTFSGWLTDRYDSRKLLFAYYGLRGLSLMLLPLAFSAGSFSMIAFIVFYGLDWVATVPPTIALATKSFGRERGPLIYGWVFASHQVGAAIAATGAGVIRTITGDYFLAFVSAGALCLVAAVLSMGIGRTAPSAATPLLPEAPLVR
ncbi:MAG: MFS transporter [Thermomicrobiales bacterium]